MTQTDREPEGELREATSAPHEVDESKFPYGYVPERLKEG